MYASSFLSLFFCGDKKRGKLICCFHIQSFRKLSKGFDTLSELADTFDSKQVAGLLRSAPDLRPNIKNVEEFFVKPEDSTYYFTCVIA